MVNRSKAKGTKFETDIVRYLEDFFPGTERRALAGTLDKGDILGVPLWIIEAKNRKVFNIGLWTEEAIVEARNAKVPYWVVVHNRPMKNVSLSHATISLRMWLELQHGIFSSVLVDPEETSDYVNDTMAYMRLVCHDMVVVDSGLVTIGDRLLLIKSGNGIDMHGDAAAVSKQAEAMGLSGWAMVHRRRQHPISESYFTMSLAAWTEMVHARQNA